MLFQCLVRPWAWWFNKVPLSVVLMLLLLDGSRFTVRAIAGLTLVVLTVCAVGNYGYALNDLYDVEEDSRVERANATASLGRRRMVGIIIGSAILAGLTALPAAGSIGTALTAIELLLPLAYSVPPWRIKERKWLGIAADAVAAHVYPAALALLAVAHLGLRPVPAMLTLCVLIWAAAVGVRGILSHQLHTAERDRQAGLTTVVHELGHLALERFIMTVLLPLEAAGFIGAVVVCDGGPMLWAFGALYVVCEVFRTLDGRFAVTALRPEGQPYLPLVDESFYKAWGPIVIALDAARADIAYLALIPLYVVLFQPHVTGEMHKLGAIGRALVKPRRPRRP
jgi:4-hydroxybenzoate polyprenyltransferase